MAGACRQDASVLTMRRLYSPRVVLCLLCLLTFAGIWRAGFIDWDDFLLVVLNQRFRPPTLSSLAAFWTEPNRGFAGLFALGQVLRPQQLAADRTGMDPVAPSGGPQEAREDRQPQDPVAQPV